MSGFWGYNEGVNERPLERDPLKQDPGDPDRLPPLWQRYVGAVLFVGGVFAIVFLVKLLG